MRDKKKITDEYLRKLIRKREEENAALNKLLKKLKSDKDKSKRITN